MCLRLGAYRVNNTKIYKKYKMVQEYENKSKSSFLWKINNFISIFFINK